jgi:hypothetical protein
MNHSPDLLPADLDYPDTEAVRLDISAIVSRGTRLRRKRLAARTAAAALVCGLVPAVVTMDVVQTAPPPQSRTIGEGYLGLRGNFGPADENRPAATASGGTVNSGVAVQAGQLAATASARLSVRLPRWYGRVPALAAGQSGPGVWFWDSSRQRIVLFHLSQAGVLRSWPIMPATSTLKADRQAGFVVTASGVAWLGINATLISFDTRTGSTRTWPLPAQTLAATPPRISALAVGPDGQVAVAAENSGSVLVLNPATGKFSQIPLPAPADRPGGLGFARSGLLGISYRQASRSHRQVTRRPSAGILLLPRSGRARVARIAESGRVSPYGASGLLVGSGRPEVVSADGVVRPLIEPPPVARPASRRGPLTVLTVLPGAWLAAGGNGGVVLFPCGATSAATATARSVFYQLPRVRCATAQPKRDCPAQIRLMAADADGDLWVVTSASPRTVVLLALASAR